MKTRICHHVLVVALACSSAQGTPQIDWLINQQNAQTGLVDSYEGDGTNRAYLYDQALAVIAFTAAGETDNAVLILEQITQLQQANGAWYECYDSTNPSVVPTGLSLYNTGPISWMAMAINFYEAAASDSNYADVAVNALNWLDSRMVKDTLDQRYGAIRYCDGPDCHIPEVISTEHNHDAYSAFFGRWILDSNQLFIDDAVLILNYQSKEMWGNSAESNCQYSSDVFWRGYNDCEWCTDPQSWGVLSLGAYGPNSEEFYKAMDWIYYSQWGNTRNSQDFNDVILNVDGFKSCTDQQETYIWVEGTEGVAAAYYSICDTQNGDYFHSQSARVVSANGGLPHTFSDTNPGQIRWPDNWRYNSAASTCWYYFNEKRINPFDLRTANKKIAADIDITGTIDFLDFSIVASDWQSSGMQMDGDINLDCTVDFYDVFILDEYWLEN